MKRWLQVWILAAQTVAWGQASTGLPAASATSFTGSLSGDVTGTQSATTVSKINGGSVPASASVLGTNSNGQPITATGTQIVTAIGSTTVANATNATNVTGTVGLGNGGTGAATAAAALSDLLGNPVAGTYAINCTSSSSCTYQSGGGGASFNVLSSTQSTTSTTATATGLSFPAVPANSTAVGSCHGQWQESSTSAYTHLALNLNNAPSLLTVDGSQYDNGTNGGVTNVISSTSSGNIAFAASNSASAANASYAFWFFVTLQTGSSEVTVGLSFYSSNASYTASIMQGTTCGWYVY